jgi:hypothetical protein
MGKKVVPFPRQSTSQPTIAAEACYQIVAQIGGTRFALEFACTAKLLPEEPATVISIRGATGASHDQSKKSSKSVMESKVERARRQEAGADD